MPFSVDDVNKTKGAKRKALPLALAARIDLWDCGHQIRADAPNEVPLHDSRASDHRDGEHRRSAAA